VPVVAKLRVSELRTLSLGAGIQLDVLRSDAHALIAWEHRNFLGGFRKFSLTTRPGAVLYPTRVPNFQRPERVLPEINNTVRLEQAGFIEARTHGVINVNYDIYPILLETNVPRGAPVVGFHELKATTGIDRRIQRFLGDLSYNFQANVPFAYRGPLTENVAPLYLSFLELKTALDFRNDRIRPTEGFYLTATTQFAGLGGDARDLRFVPSANVYIPIKPKRLGVAVRAQIGMLEPFNYTMTSDTSGGSVKEAQIAYFRALFSGGPTSNRGYPIRGVGPAGSLPFFSPGVEQRLGRGACDSASVDYDPAQCQTPVGGQSMWEASVELRLNIIAAFSAAFFCDTSDVGRNKFEFNFTRLHLSCGLGPRYDTPVGPIRLDVAYRIPGLQTIGDPGRAELDPGNLLGLPINIALGFGEVF
jgi:Omp85 superfamily domain